MQHERPQVPPRKFGDLGHVAADERFAPGEPHGVHRRQLAIDPLDLVGCQVPVGRHLPTVAHDAPGIAAEGDGVREEAGRVLDPMAIAEQRADEGKMSQHDRIRTKEARGGQPGTLKC